MSVPLFEFGVPSRPRHCTHHWAALDIDVWTEPATDKDERSESKGDCCEEDQNRPGCGHFDILKTQTQIAR